MSFGLRDILATFEHLMSFVVSGVEGCAVFLDNIVVFIATPGKIILSPSVLSLIA